jgi:hypothetical protein
MKKYTHVAYLGAVATIAAILLPTSASAATVYVQSSRTALSVGDTAVLTVKIDADAAVLNTIEGDITINSNVPGAVSVQQFSLGSSAFGLWPRTPSLSSDGTDVSFVGGIPGGFSIEGATVFKIIVQAVKPGTISVAPQNIEVLANDGKGTPVPVKLQGTVITVSPASAGAQPVNDWSSIVATDTTPPEPFIIVLGQDPSIFSGKKFAYFSAVDSQSGIDHYDVSEDGAPVVRSGSMYVLQNQTGNIHLVVTAYDKAGNERVAYYPMPSTNQGADWVSIAAVVIFIAIIYLAYAFMWPGKKKHHVPTQNQ